MFTVVALLTGRRALLFLDYFGFYARASISWQPLFFFLLASYCAFVESFWPTIFPRWRPRKMIIDRTLIDGQPAFL